MSKIISKTNVNKLKHILSSCISDVRRFFVLGRLISDNVLVAYELLHNLKNRKGRESQVALKLDMSKAYDRIEWSFLIEMMHVLGFQCRWISLIMKCITSIIYTMQTQNLCRNMIEKFKVKLSKFIFIR